MGQQKTVWDNPAEVIRHLAPEHPVMVFAPTVLQDRARQFIDGFPGLVTYAVKSNPGEEVVENLPKQYTDIWAASSGRKSVPADISAKSSLVIEFGIAMYRASFKEEGRAAETNHLAQHNTTCEFFTTRPSQIVLG